MVFRYPDDTRSEPVSLGDRINTPGELEFAPYVSSDGKCFFFMSPRVSPDLFAPGAPMTWARQLKIHDTPGNGTAAIWWVAAAFIETLHPGRGH